jgi:hypothetical protein
MALCFPTPAATSAIAVNCTRRIISSVLLTKTEAGEVNPRYV